MTREEIYGIGTGDYFKELGKRYTLVQLEYDVSLLSTKYLELRDKYKLDTSTVEDYEQVVIVQEKYYAKVEELNRVVASIAED